MAGVSATISGSYFVFSDVSGEHGGLEVGDGPRGLAINPFTNTVYIANYASDTISVIDGDTNTVQDTIQFFWKGQTSKGLKPMVTVPERPGHTCRHSMRI